MSNAVEVSVARDTGHVYVDGRTLSPAEAVVTALQLVQAAQLSQNRSQVGAPRFNDSGYINARAESPLGRAITALKDIRFDGVYDAWRKGVSFAPEYDCECLDGGQDSGSGVCMCGGSTR